jgi:4-hydroxythreonine-4-phosphate dehydrogenase
MDPAMKPLIALTMGDPAGIGPEIIVKVLARPHSTGIAKLCRTVVIGDRPLFERTARRLGIRCGFRSIAHPEDAEITKEQIDIVDLKNVDPSGSKLGRPGAVGGRAAVEAIQVAVHLALSRRISAIVTAPISKEALQASGYIYPGHTELLAKLCRVADVGMLMVAPLSGMLRSGPYRPTSPRPPQLRILLATTHLALGDVPKALTRERISTAIRLGRDAGVRYFGLRRPRLGVTGLNPHAGEGGLFGREEDKVIRPAVESAAREGIDVIGPRPADTLIRRAFEGRYDLVVAMYHDQALIPIKLLGFGRAVNVTVGLPFIRTSPDHGTAYDIAGKGIADPGSLIEAIRLAATFSAKKK